MQNMNGRPQKGLVEIIDEVVVSSEDKNTKLEVARKLEAYHKLEPKAGVGDVVLFETEAELREEVIKTCSFELGVEDDGSLRGLRFRRITEEGELSSDLNLILPSETKLRSVSMHLAWLAWTQEYKRVPSLWGFTFQEGVALFHRRRQRKEHEDLWEWNRRSDYHEHAELQELPRACFVRESGKLYSENPAKMRSARKVRHRTIQEDRHITGAIMGYYESNEDYVTTEPDFDASALFKPYESLIAEDMIAIRSTSPIDLSSPVDSPLLLRLKASVESRSGPVVGSERETGRYSSAEIYEMIGRYWDELIFSPWDDKTTKEYAILKTLCKRGSEGVNVWSEKTKGLFGFRVRTRDHNWIKGQIYCPADALSPKPNDDIGTATWEGRAGFTYKIGGSVYSGWQYHSMFVGEVVSVGRCKFFISCERDR